MDSEPVSSDQALLSAAIDAFGARGLEGASTRDIARAAGKPMSAITYHFGGKEGLYLACARHIAQTLSAFLSPAMAAATVDPDTDAARVELGAILQAFVNAMVRPETAVFARFISREQMEPTAAFAILYDGIMGTLKTRVDMLLTIVSGGQIGETEASIRGIALIGQVLAFRLARAAVLRSTGWHEIGAAETAQIHAVVQSHLAAILDSLARETPA